MLDEIQRGTERTQEGLDACARLLRKLTPYIGKLARHADEQELDFDPVYALAPTVKCLEQLTADLLTTVAERGVNLADIEMQPDGQGQAPNTPPGAMPEDCVFRGQAPGMPVATLLQFLSTQHRTGTLQIATHDETFTIGLVSGSVVHAVSDGTPLDDRLGSLLLKHGALGAEQLTDLLDRSSAEGMPLGRLIEDEDIVTPEQLQAALEEQVQLLFRRLFAQAEADFAFYEGGAARPEVGIDMDMTRLLLESARVADEEQQQSVAAWEDWMN